MLTEEWIEVTDNFLLFYKIFSLYRTRDTKSRSSAEVKTGVENNDNN